MREKKDTEVLKETLVKISEENEALVKQIYKNNEETYVLKDTLAKVSDEKEALFVQVK